MQTDASAVRDADGAVVKQVGEFRQTAIAANGGRVAACYGLWCEALPGLVRDQGIYALGHFSRGNYGYGLERLGVDRRN